MSFFEDASLVLIPSAQKTSKVYSVKPTDGTGDLTFTRSNDTATRVGPDGLIEKVRTNRFTYSQDLSNAAWKTATDGGSITKTANAGTAPDGTNTATRVQVAGGGTYSLVYQDNVNPLGSVVVSGYFKRYGGTNQTFRLFGDNGSALSGTLTATDTWQRFSFVMNASSAGADGLAADASNNAYDILVWGMQLETGDIATDYIATTTAAVSVGPVANVPRLDYLNSSCPRLLLEPQRTNTLTYSEAFDNAAWTKLNATISANTTDTLDPSGYNSADKITDDTTNGAHIVYRLSTWDTTQRTASVYAKAGTASKISIQNASTGQGAFFDLSTGTITALSAPFTATITAVGNGWYRLTTTHTAGSSQTFSIGMYEGTANYIYSGTGSYAYIWGAQLEQGSYPSSYIGPTLGAAVTRGADACSKTGISSLIGQTAGTVFVEFEFSGSKDSFWPIITVMGAGAGELIEIYGSAGNNNMGVVMVDNGVTQLSQTITLTVGRHKLAIAYELNNTVAYLDGTVIGGVDTSCTIPTMTEIALGKFSYSSAYTYGDRIDQAILFPVRLSDSDLAALTTL